MADRTVQDDESATHGKMRLYGPFLILSVSKRVDRRLVDSLSRVEAQGQIEISPRWHHGRNILKYPLSSAFGFWACVAKFRVSSTRTLWTWESLYACVMGRKFLCLVRSSDIQEPNGITLSL